MADGTTTPAGEAADALQGALAAEHAAVWGYGVVGAALPADARAPVAAAEDAHRDARDALLSLLSARGVEPVAAEGAYALPFPVLSPADAAALAVTLEDGAAVAWVRVLDRAADADVRRLAVEVLGSTEVRAVGWRRRAGRTPLTQPFPGLPEN
jgi:Domain of unknown function (DUF4439)